MLSSLSSSKETPDKRDPDTSSPPIIILTATTATPIQNHTANTPMVQNSNIFQVLTPPNRTYTGYFPLHITSSCPITATYVYPPYIPTRVLPTYPLITPGLLSCTETK